MANKLLIQGKGVQWLANDQTGAALVEIVGGLSGSTEYLTMYDQVGDTTAYVGKAVPGSATSSAVWQIKKLTYGADGDVTTDGFADGNSNFDNIWDNRASLSYS